MPWYWTDDIVAAAADKHVHEIFSTLDAMNLPIAIRRHEESIEDLVRTLEDEGEVPLAA